VITTGSGDLGCPDRSSSKRPPFGIRQKKFEGNAVAHQEIPQFVPSSRLLFADDVHGRPIRGAFACPVLQCGDGK
jgi:hypothetical protein